MMLSLRWMDATKSFMRAGQSGQTGVWPEFEDLQDAQVFAFFCSLLRYDERIKFFHAGEGGGLGGVRVFFGDGISFHSKDPPLFSLCQTERIPAGLVGVWGAVGESAREWNSLSD